VSSWALEKATFGDKRDEIRSYFDNSDLTTLSVDRGAHREQYGGLRITDGETYDSRVQLNPFLSASEQLTPAIFSLPKGLPPQGLFRFRYRKHLIVIYHRWFTFLLNTMRENAHGETDPR
jgi:hypothetical protein